MGPKIVKFLKKHLSNRVRLYRNTLFVLLVALPAVRSEAQTVTVPSPNGLITLQATLSGAGSGLSDWQFNGASQLNQQWFYYSLGSGAVNSIDQIASPSAINNHGGPAPFLSATYANSNISVTAKFQINNLPTLSDTLTIQNSSTTTQTFHFYQFSDFDLGGVAGSQNVQFSANGGQANYQVNQTGLGGVSLQGLLVGASAPLGSAQAGLSTTFGLANGNPAPTLDNVTLFAGPGDAVYAYEWDQTLAPGASFQVTELQTLSVVPEPSCVALMGCGMLALLYRFRPGKQRNGGSC